ncbi:MAG: phosphatase PAP2 family protein [Fidelibacterota bacterium]
MKNFLRNYFPTELALQIYNLLIFIFILVFSGKINDSGFLLSIHLILAILIGGLQYIKVRYENIAINFLIIVTPVLLFSYFHYETGLINRVIFPDFFDDAIWNLDRFIFGQSYHEIWAKAIDSEIVDQLIHFFYFSYYGILFIPAVLLMIRERQNTYNPGWTKLVLTRRLLFTTTFTMLSCYLIFIIYPVKGPVDYHAVLFPEPKYMVAVMDFLYAHGDTAGGAVPSSHVAVSLVITIFCFRHFKEIRWYLLVFFIFLAIATTYCSYHYFVDVLGGVLAGLVFYIMGGKIFDCLCCGTPSGTGDG